MAAFFLRLQDEGCRRGDDDDDSREGDLGLGRPVLHTTTPVLLSLTHGLVWGGCTGGGGELVSVHGGLGSVRLTKRLLLSLEPYGSRGSLILWK